MTFWSLLTGRRLLQILVALVGLTLVVDMCALPAAAESGHVEATASDSHPSDGSHVASCCDAKAAKAASSCPHATGLLVALPTEVETVNGAPRSDQALLTLLAPRRAPDRSLFLLHAVFLI